MRRAKREVRESAGPRVALPVKSLRNVALTAPRAASPR